jgi:hypothetical protein
VPACTYINYTLANSIISQLGADIDGAGVEISVVLHYQYHQMEAVLRLVHHIRTGTYEIRTCIYQYSYWLGSVGRDIDGEAEGDLSGLSVSLSSDGTRRLRTK